MHFRQRIREDKRHGKRSRKTRERDAIRRELRDG